MINTTGLSKETIQKIQSIFVCHTNIEQVFLYGSRAKRTFRNGSDIDLCIMKGNVLAEELSLIEIELDNLMLPYTIDLSVFGSIKDDNFSKQVRDNGLEFYLREKG